MLTHIQNRLLWYHYHVSLAFRDAIQSKLKEYITIVLPVR